MQRVWNLNGMGVTPMLGALGSVALNDAHNLSCE
jgi:hypothetical protein